MDSAFALFTAEEFYERRPRLSLRQLQLKSAYYNARRETKEGTRVKSSTLKEFLADVQYEEDIALSLLQKVDDYYLKLYSDQLKRKAKQ